MSTKAQPFLIFDFDGTLVDSYSCMIDKFILLADEFKFKKIERDKVPELKHLSSMELIRYLQIPFYKLPFIIRAARKLLREAMPHLLPVPGMENVLTDLNQKGIEFGIVTSNSTKNVETWLATNNLLSYFNFIKTENNYFSKYRLLKSVIKQHQLQDHEVWYIGDETRDIEAGKSIGIKTAGVCWGYNSEKALSREEPDLIVTDPSSLLNYFKEVLC